MFHCIRRWVTGYAGFLLREGYIAYCMCQTAEFREILKEEQDTQGYFSHPDLCTPLQRS